MQHIHVASNYISLLTGVLLCSSHLQKSWYLIKQVFTTAVHQFKPLQEMSPTGISLEQWSSHSYNHNLLSSPTLFVTLSILKQLLCATLRAKWQAPTVSGTLLLRAWLVPWAFTLRSCFASHILAMHILKGSCFNVSALPLCFLDPYRGIKWSWEGSRKILCHFYSRCVQKNRIFVSIYQNHIKIARQQ